MANIHDFETSISREDTGSLKWQKYAGKEVLPMWVADMDFKAPAAVTDALLERVEHGVYGYTVPYPSVVDTVIEYMLKEHGVEIEAEWIIWMPGLVPALNTASRAYETPGDGVMTNTPVYPPFLTAPGWQDKRLISVPLINVDGKYTFDFDAMEAAVTESTKLFILCNPHNPVGRVYTKEELSELASFCQRHNLIVVSDEIHCDLILDQNKKHTTFMALGGWAKENSLTMMAPSKTYNIPGLACSFIIVPNSQVRLKFQRAARGMITEVNCFGYTGCEAAYKKGHEWKSELLEKLRENYQLTLSFVREHMPKIEMIEMEATYLAWMDMRSLKLEDPEGYFEKAGVGLSNGKLFGSAGFLRLNFGCPTAMLQEALNRMKSAYDAL